MSKETVDKDVWEVTPDGDLLKNGVPHPVNPKTPLAYGEVIDFGPCGWCGCGHYTAPQTLWLEEGVLRWNIPAWGECNYCGAV